MRYDEYNREERYICCHLFRLLHEWIVPSSTGEQIGEFLALSGSNCPLQEWPQLGIFSEVALIRDAFFARKPNVAPFMESLIAHVADQEGVIAFTPFSAMPGVLTDPSLTHPKQICAKAKAEGIELSDADYRVYGAVQTVFNAKPDLAITYRDQLIVYEAKFTEVYDTSQLQRTRKIAEIWATLLYADLGFHAKPKVGLATIGPH